MGGVVISDVLASFSCVFLSSFFLLLQHHIYPSSRVDKVTTPCVKGQFKSDRQSWRVLYGYRLVFHRNDYVVKMQLFLRRIKIYAFSHAMQITSACAREVYLLPDIPLFLFYVKIPHSCRQIWHTCACQRAIQNRRNWKSDRQSWKISPSVIPSVSLAFLCSFFRSCVQSLIACQSSRAMFSAATNNGLSSERTDGFECSLPSQWPSRPGSEPRWVVGR